MALLNFSRLTPDDLLCIERGTVPLENSPDLVSRTEEGGVVFSIRALKLYTQVCSKYGLQQELTQVQDWDAYTALKQEIFRRCTLASEADLELALASRKIPLQERELAMAMLSEDPERIASAASQFASLKDSSPNVVPIGSAKKMAAIDAAHFQ